MAITFMYGVAETTLRKENRLESLNESGMQIKQKGSAMPKAELVFQTEIIKSLREQGGRGLKLAHRMSVGVPDLLLVAPVGAFLMEAKDLGEVGPTFSRKTGITLIQTETLRRFNEAAGRVVAVQLIHLVDGGERRAVVWPAHLDRIDHNYRTKLIWVSRQRGSVKWDVVKLMQMASTLPKFEKI